MRKRLATLAELRSRRAIKFPFRQDGIAREGFLVMVRGRVVAYENVCRHLPLSLDYGGGPFFTPDGRHIICHTHGAMYEPLSGLCVAGPCSGASLKKLEVKIVDEAIWFEEEDS